MSSETERLAAFPSLLLFLGEGFPKRGVALSLLAHGIIWRPDFDATLDVGGVHQIRISLVRSSLVGQRLVSRPSHGVPSAKRHLRSSLMGMHLLSNRESKHVNLLWSRDVRLGLNLIGGSRQIRLRLDFGLSSVVGPKLDFSLKKHELLHLLIADLHVLAWSCGGSDLVPQPIHVSLGILDETRFSLHLRKVN